MRYYTGIVTNGVRKLHSKGRLNAFGLFQQAMNWFEKPKHSALAAMTIRPPLERLRAYNLRNNLARMKFPQMISLNKSLEF